jgi:hypothetical protein
MRFKGFLRHIVRKDRELHEWVMGHFPRPLRAIDWFLEWLFAVVTHAAFAIIVAFLLVVLVATNVINVIVAASIAGAWLVALIWIARSKSLKNLTILSRWVLVSVIGIVLGLAGSALGDWALKQYNRQKTSEQSPDNKRQLGPKIQVKTLHDLFVSDCEHTRMFSKKLLAINGNRYDVEYSICGDFQSKSFYLSFFLPNSNSTLPVCHYLPTTYKEVVSDILNGNIKTLMQGMIHQAPGERPETWTELKPSGRVFVYSETNLLQSAINTLTKEYEKEGLSPQFRSRDYEILRNSPLYDGQHY